MTKLFYFGEPDDPKFDKIEDPLIDEYGIDNYFQETINLNVLKDDEEFDKIR